MTKWVSFSELCPVYTLGEYALMKTVGKLMCRNKSYIFDPLFEGSHSNPRNIFFHQQAFWPQKSWFCVKSGQQQLSAPCQIKKANSFVVAPPRSRHNEGISWNYENNVLLSLLHPLHSLLLVPCPWGHFHPLLAPVRSSLGTTLPSPLCHPGCPPQWPLGCFSLLFSPDSFTHCFHPYLSCVAHLTYLGICPGHLVPDRHVFARKAHAILV